jgi:hypothetical protein
MRQIVIADTETTRIEPNYRDGSGVIWELGLIEYGSVADPSHRRERLWRMKPDPSKADEGALAVGRFYERTKDMCAGCTRPERAWDLTMPPLRGDSPEWSSPEALALDVARRLDDVTLVAANPAFDAGYLRAYLRHYGQAATWHYRLRDIGSMAWAWLQARARDAEAAGSMMRPNVPPFDASTADFAVALGVDPGQFETHSALGDCRLNAAMLDVMTGAPA